MGPINFRTRVAYFNPPEILNIAGQRKSSSRTAEKEDKENWLGLEKGKPFSLSILSS